MGLKNDLEQVAALVEYFDFALNEQCHEYDECGALRPFTAAGKPVFNAEYTEEDTLEAARLLSSRVCPAAAAAGLRSLILPWALDDAFCISCDR